MSKNRLKIGSKEFVFSKKRKTRRERKQDKHSAEKLAGEIYTRWRSAFTSTPVTPEQIPSRLLSLREELEHQVSNKRVRAKYLEKVDQFIEKAYVIYGTPPEPPQETAK